MKRIATTTALLALSGALAIHAQMAPMDHTKMDHAAPPPPTGPAGEAVVSFGRQKDNVIKAAEKMPAADYTFKITPDVRTYARIVNHVIEAQNHSCTALAGDKFDPASVPADTATKEVIVTALKASFAECDKGFATLTDAKMGEMLAVGPAKRSRTALAWGTISHDNEQYAQLSLYLRLKGITPPTAEK